MKETRIYLIVRNVAAASGASKEEDCSEEHESDGRAAIYEILLTWSVENPPFKMGTNDERPIVRSINSDHIAPVRFVNTTMHRVQVLWINFEGQAVRYGTLEPGDTLAMTTYATHPWIFVETLTMDRFVVAGKDVFYPEPWFVKYRGFPRSQIPKEIPPELVYITLPMYTLRDIALRAIKADLYDDNDAYLLDIPKNLQEELACMNPRKNAASRRRNLGGN